MRWSELMNFYDRAMSWEQREIEFTLNDFCDRPNLYYAAPDLLEALEYVRNSLTDETDKELTGIDFANELYEIDTAIAKARGVS